MISDNDVKEILAESRPEWCIVHVLAPGALYQRPRTGDILLDQLAGLAASNDVRVVIVTDDRATAAFLREAYLSLFQLIHYQTPALGPNSRTSGAASDFSWAKAANIGASACRSAKRLLFVQTGVTFQGDDIEASLAALAVALDAPGADNGIALPMVNNPEHGHNPAQSCVAMIEGWQAAEIPFFDISEFADDSAIAVSGGAFWPRAGGFDEWIDGGSEWAIIDLQHKLADQGMGTVVVPGVTVNAVGRHASAHVLGGHTHDYQRGLLRFCARHSIHCDRKSRPSLPRLSVRPGGGKRHNKSMCAVVDGLGDLPALKAVLTASVACDELVVIDRAPSREMQEFVHGVKAATRGRYAPAWGWVPTQQALNLADGVEAALVVAPVFDDVIEGPRLRLGHRYGLPQLERVLHIGMLEGCGLGDTLMMTAAIHALKTRHPHLQVIAHHGWEAGRVLENNPDIAEVHIHGPNEKLPPETTQFVGIGVEGTLRHHFEALSIGKIADESPDMRRVHYYITPDEHKAAREMLDRAAAIPVADDAYLVGVQLAGAWQVKEWAHTRALVDELLESGATVLVFAAGGMDTSALPVLHERLVLCTGQPIRTAIAALGLCDAFVGFDSGLAFAAGAIGTPTVTLWGPNDPAGFLLDTDPLNAHALRRRTPAQCNKEFGTDCRSATAGSRCPLRGEGERGGLCLDEITVEDVLASLSDLPRWDRPLSSRYRSGD